MAFLCTQTFLTDSAGAKIDGGKVLENKIAHALYRITGRYGVSDTREVDSCKQADDGKVPAMVTRSGLNYPAAPYRLRQERDTLKEDWKLIWKKVTIEYSDEETGASIYLPPEVNPIQNKRVRIGPFFLSHHYTIRDFEKIVLHEFLHAALDIDMREAQHGMMEQVLVFNMGYAPPANPVSLD
jgi:hypothetical protein